MNITKHWAQDVMQDQLSLITDQLQLTLLRIEELDSKFFNGSIERLTLEVEKIKATRTAIYNSAVKEGVINGWMRNTTAYCEGCCEWSYVWDVKMVVAPGSVTWMCSNCRRENE